MPGQTDPAIIRNFCIIAHIDHGKSTLADRMLQLTGVVDERAARAQYLDRMDIERERGITIKSQAVRMPWGVDPDNAQGTDAGTYVLNMIDTPGHVDFTYEVSRFLEACEAAILLVDAAQGIEAQTLANLYLAMGADLHIIPVLNKIDLPSANPEKYAAELAGLVGCEPEDVLQVSAKTGFGVEALLDEIVKQTPPPVGAADKPARALIFDSVYDPYRGVVTYVRVVDGKLNHRDRIKMMSTGATHEMLEVGVISPEQVKAGEIGVGEVGYLITGVKDVRQSRVGDTITTQHGGATDMLGGYKHPNPMVYAGLYPIDGDQFGDLREALEKLQLNDAALTYEPETSGALGFGFRCGFLGLLHMEITRDRLEREFGLDLISTAPNVVYDVVMEDGTEVEGTNPSEFPEGKIHEVRELVALCRHADDVLGEPLGAVLVHGDLNPKNVLLEQGPDGAVRVSGVLDWEFAHAGHPFTDLGNLLRFDRRPALHDAVLATYADLRGLDVRRALDLARAADLPALVTVSNELGEPRYATLRGIMAAGRKAPTVWTADDLGLEQARLAPRVRVTDLFVPVSDKGCQFIEVVDEEDAGRLLALKLREDKLI